MIKRSLMIKKVRDIINKHDPIGLVKLGCPINEYHPEVKQIISKINLKNSVNELQEAVYHIFVNMFDKKLVGPKSKYQELSAEIFALKIKK